MANLREIKSKIKSVKNLKKITRALEVVSTVKLQKSKDYAESLQEYIVDLMTIVNNVGGAQDIFAENSSKLQKKLILCVTSERGLCGGLNSKLLRKIYKEHSKDDADYFVIGKKGLEFFKRADANITGSLHLSDTFGEEDLIPLFTYFDSAIDSGEYSEIVLYFNYFKNSIAQIPTGMQLYPLTQESFKTFLSDINTEASSMTLGDKDLIVEPSKEEYIKELRRQIRNYILTSALIHNKTGEHAARMIAMKNAKDNATDFVKSLTLSFNKARQGAITQEISEIVSAKIAIEA